jgi:hypothetical protein
MRKIIATIAAGAALIGSAGAIADSGRAVEEVNMPNGAHARTLVTGCGMEDQCRINYRPSGTWAITRVNP